MVFLYKINTIGLEKVTRSRKRSRMEKQPGDMALDEVTTSVQAFESSHSSELEISSSESSSSVDEVVAVTSEAAIGDQLS
jgi:hypothetical protein